MSSKLAPITITDSDKTKKKSEKCLPTADIKFNVDINILLKNVKQNHVIKDVQTDILKHTGMAPIVKE